MHGALEYRLTKPLSIREFVLSNKPTTKVDTALVIGFHLEKFSGTSPFNLDDQLPTLVRCGRVTCGGVQRVVRQHRDSARIQLARRFPQGSVRRDHVEFAFHDILELHQSLTRID